MIAFDTDILTELLVGNEKYRARAMAIPTQEQAVPAPALEEIMRGRLHGIRLAEQKKRKLSIDVAYGLFVRTFSELRLVRILPYAKEAEDLFQSWQKQKLRVSTRDLRIAATCVTERITLVTRNRRDFERVPGLSVEFWK